MSGSRDGKSLTQEQIDKLIGTRHFQSALMMTRQLEFSIFDMNIHFKRLTTAEEVQKELDDIRAKINLLPAPSYNKFQNGFSHIFAGGYAAGYYSYKWAEILSSDVFSRFEQEGILNADTGQSLLENIISKGLLAMPRIILLHLWVANQMKKPCLDIMGLDKTTLTVLLRGA